MSFIGLSLRIESFDTTGKSVCLNIQLKLPLSIAQQSIEFLQFGYHD